MHIGHTHTQPHTHTHTHNCNEKCFEHDTHIIAYDTHSVNVCLPLFSTITIATDMQFTPRVHHILLKTPNLFMPIYVSFGYSSLIPQSK